MYHSFIHSFINQFTYFLIKKMYFSNYMVIKVPKNYNKDYKGS